MRRYELMLVIRPDAPEDRAQAVIEKVTRHVLGSGGTVVKQAPWGRRRLAYQIDRYRDGSYHIIHFEIPPESVNELERTLLITEDVLRHLVTRIERPLKAGRGKAAEDGVDIVDLPVVDESEEDLEPPVERIDESETEAAPAAVD